MTQDSRPRRTPLYRLYNAQNRLIYIGITWQRLPARMAEHASEQPWWDEVDHATAVWYESREEAAAAERAAIKAERPLYNIIHACTHPSRAPRLAPGPWLDEIAMSLYTMRRMAGLRCYQLAELLGCPPKRITNLQWGNCVPQEAEITAWARACGRPDEAGRLLRIRAAHVELLIAS